MLGVTAITGIQKGATALAVLVPLLIFALPISETLHSVARRPGGGQGLRRVFEADRATCTIDCSSWGCRRGPWCCCSTRLASLSLLALATLVP